MSGEHLGEDFQHCLTNIRRRHRRQRKADVIHSNRDLHAGVKLREQRIAIVRMIERVANRRLTIRQSHNRRLRIDNARADGQVFENKILARRNNAWRAVAVNIDD